MSAPTPTQHAFIAIPDMGLSDTELAALKEKFRNNIVESMQGKDAQAKVEVSVSVTVKF